MGALPIISAGVGIAGTIIGASEQQRQASEQQKLVNQQIAANQLSDSIRMQDITMQREFLFENWKLENQRRLMELGQAKSEFESNAVQNTMAQTAATQQINAQRSAGELQLNQASEQVNQRMQQYENAKNSAVYQALAEKAQTDSEAAKLFNQMNQALAQGDTQLYAFLGSVMSNGGLSESDMSAARASSAKQMAQLLASLQQGDNLSGAELQKIVMSEDFARILDSVAQLEGGSAREAIQRQYADLIGTSSANQKATDKGWNINADALAKVLQMLPINAEIAQRQANMNYLAGNNAVNAKAMDIQAQSLANSAQLLRSVPQAPGFLSTALGVANAAMPLASYLVPRPSLTSNVRPNVSLTTPLATLPGVDVYPSTPGYPQYQTQNYA